MLLSGRGLRSSFFLPSEGERKMEEFKGNSNKSKEQAEEKKLTPVVKGNVTIKKDSVGKKFSDVFLSDTVDNVKSYLLFDIIVPAVKDLIVDMITSGTNMLVNGDAGRSHSSGKKKSGGHTSYTSYYRGGSSRDDDRRSAPRKDRHGVADISFETRGDAKEVADMMLELLDNFKVVSVADYYEISNAGDLETYIDRKYGWYELDDMQITRDRDGFKIKLPRPEPLD